MLCVGWHASDNHRLMLSEGGFDFDFDAWRDDLRLKPSQTFKKLSKLFHSSIHEYLAFERLTTVNGSGLLQDPQVAEWKIVQRFPLALIYFSTNGPEWKFPPGFLSSEDECAWNEIVPYIDADVWLNQVNQTTRLSGVTSCDGDGRLLSIRIMQNNFWFQIPTMLFELPFSRLIF